MLNSNFEQEEQTNFEPKNMPTSPFNHEQLSKPLMMKKPPKKAVAFFEESEDESKADSFINQPPPVVQKQTPPPLPNIQPQVEKEPEIQPPSF